MRKLRFVGREWLAAAILLISACVTFGQTPTPTPEAVTGSEENPGPNHDAVAETERIIVTGSHIPTAEEVGPNPVQEINREQIEKSGERTAAELLRRLPVAGPAGVPTANDGNSEIAGASAIALRGFDASSTLVLLDGRRLAPYPLGAPPTGGVTFIDLNSIPKGAIESIEILKDSASSIYGADAVAGVVNIKFRRNYSGSEITTSYGNTLGDDSGEETASLISGAGDDKTNVVALLTYYHRNSIFERDRDYSAVTGMPSQDSSPINLQLSRAAVLAAGVLPGQLPPPNRRLFGHAPFLTNGSASASDYVYTPFRSSVYNYNVAAQATPDSERYGGFVTASRKIFDDQLVAYSDFFYQNVNTRYELAPTATFLFQQPGHTTLAIPPHAPGATLGGPSYAETGVPVGAYNPFNPFQQIISGGTRARLAEFGNRINENETDALFSTFGLKGDKLFGGAWGYDAGLRYSQVKNTANLTGVSASRFNRILNAADPIFDPTSTEFIGTTVPYNPFGDYHRPIPSNFLPIQFATIHTKDVEQSKLATLDLNIYTTSLFTLPAGGVGLAFGGQFRRETLKQKPDQLQIEGDILGASPGFNTAAGRRSYAFYAETSVPIVSSVNPLPGVRSLEFTGAARFEEYENNGTNVVVPKVGMRWQPLDESLTVRATWGEGFHEPSLIELFGNPTDGVNADLTLIDRRTGMPAGEFPFIIRTNPNLQPEDSRSFSGGFVYTPKFLRGLTLTVDLWDIESTGRAFIPEFQNILDREALGQLLPLEKVNRDTNGEIIFLELAFQNAGSRKARGVDFGLTYEVQTQVGTFTSATQATYFDSLQFAETANEPEMELRGTGFGSHDGPLKWKGTSTLDWTWRNVSAGITAYYIDGFHESIVAFNSNDHYVSQTWLFDLRASYTFALAPHSSAVAAETNKDMIDAVPSKRVEEALPIWKRLLDGTTITVGCNNVFDHDPPRALTGENYPSFLYDPTGRFVYVSLTKKF